MSGAACESVMRSMYITTARSTAKIVVVRRALVGIEDTLDRVCGDVAMRIPVADPVRPRTEPVATKQSGGC
jgi:hypothetical protein